jgi:hypothetical protein
MSTIKIDMSNLPSDLALFLAHQEHTRALADHLSASMELSDEDRGMLHDELVGTVANMVDGHLRYATAPKN